MKIDLLKKFPKTELHYHISGSIRPETIYEIAKKENFSLPVNDFDSFKKLVMIEDNTGSLKNYIKKFDYTLPVMQKAEYIYRITSEIVDDLAQNNVRYAELRIAPFLHIDGGLYLEEVVESVLKALNDGEKDSDINTNLILIAMRNHEPKKSLEVVKTAEKYLDYGVVGVDLAGDEADFPPEIHKKAFEKAAEYGLHRTVHAGEAAGPENIKTAVEELFAERIGHGVRLQENKALYKLLKDNDTALEVCLLSNLQTNAVQDLRKHPVKEYFSQDIPVTINTDNTTVSNTDINNEYSILFEKLNFDFLDFKKIIFNGIKYSFADEKLKEKLTLKFK